MEVLRVASVRTEVLERLPTRNWASAAFWSVVKSSEVAQSCLTLCNPIDCSLSGSSIHGIFQARVLEWTAISFSRGSSRPRTRTPVSHIAGRFFTIWATRESEVAQPCPTLCDPMESSLHQAPPSVGFSRQEYWSGLPFPSPGNLPDPGIEPRSPSL